ncbi:MAG: hypothetical protein WC417_06230 [Candidatus Omnitrophota bacterium]|jgi:hypothetical protein
MVTIFSCPKPFIGKINIIQRNAIKSWLLLKSKPEVILIGDESGCAEVCREFGIRHIREAERGAQGTPLVRSLFNQAQQLASFDTLCYINADIILTDDFIAAIKLTQKWADKFLMIGRRYDLQISEEIDFNKADWVEIIKSRASKNGRLHSSMGMDYFIFKRGLYSNMPDFVVGRPCWDGWFVYEARQARISVVDATSKISAFHQNHEYRTGLIDKNGDWDWNDSEVKGNLKASGGLRRDISNATHKIRNNRIRRRILYLWIEPGIFLIRNIIRKIKPYSK